MKRLTKKKYWTKNFRGKSAEIISKLTSLTSKSIYFYELNKIITPYLKPGSKIFEVGCAPGNLLISLAKKNKLVPYGVEYSKDGVNITKKNFEKNGFTRSNVIHADFFSKKFLKENHEKYDIVYSLGFIEHFEDAANVVKMHTDILRKGGVLIISVPNLPRGNKLFLEKKIIEKHNLKIMSPEQLEKLMPKNIQVKEKKYFGGPFNVGMLKYDNKILELTKIAVFVFQRAILEPIIFLLSKMGINLNNRQFSPGIIIIGVKK